LQEDDEEYGDEKATAYGEEDEGDEEDEEEEKDNVVMTKEEQSKYPYMQMVLDLLANLKKKNPQYDINGHRNTWILKPGGKSRGRGIKCFRSYEKMMQHIRKIHAR
jgi:tubulin monoglycylase TTLL3/8